MDPSPSAQSVRPSSQQAPASLSATVALFVSDIHLQPEAPATAHTFFEFLAQYGHCTQQLYLLGDVFEYWAGDDDIDTPFNMRVVAALREISDAGVAVFWIAGNRDFLVGETFAAAAGLTRLTDPSIVSIAKRTLILSHGDAYCTDDVDYQLFRAQVRNEQWQQQFLSMPLAQRLQIIKKMREGSRMAQRTKTESIMDVNPTAISTLFAQSAAHTMIHGHTHRPARHETTVGDQHLVRYVLSDWDYDGNQSRGGGLAIDASGCITPIPAHPNTLSIL